MIQITALIDRRYQLEGMTDIPDMKAYAEEWRKLSADFEALGMMSNGAMCQAKANHYASLDGQYSRVFETVNFVSLSQSERNERERMTK